MISRTIRRNSSSPAGSKMPKSQRSTGAVSFNLSVRLPWARSLFDTTFYHPQPFAMATSALADNSHSPPDDGLKVKSPLGVVGCLSSHPSLRSGPGSPPVSGHRDGPVIFVLSAVLDFAQSSVTEAPPLFLCPELRKRRHPSLLLGLDVCVVGIRTNVETMYHKPLTQIPQARARLRRLRS